jgi:hypothetical protein
MIKNELIIKTNFLNDLNNKINNVIFILETPKNFINEYDFEDDYYNNYSLLIQNEVPEKKRNDYVVYINLYKCGLNIKTLEKAYIQALGRMVLMELEKEINPVNELLKGWQLIESLKLKPTISKEEFFEDIKYLLIDNLNNKKLNIIL